MLLVACGEKASVPEKTINDIKNDTEQLETKQNTEEQAQKETENTANIAPEFTITTLTGQKFALYENRGKVTVMYFWATWCAPCMRGLPTFEKLQEKYNDNLEILCVNLDATEEDLRDFMKEKGFTFPVVADVYGEISALYPTDGIPYTVLVDQRGNIAKTFTGAGDPEEMMALYGAEIDRLLETKE